MVIIDETFENNTISIGENQTDNDLLLSSAYQNDLWFHLADFPSCHVIIQNNKQSPITKKMTKYCAELVKTHTKFKYRKVSVIYTNVKNVRKTNIKGQVTIKGKVQTIVV